MRTATVTPALRNMLTSEHLKRLRAFTLVEMLVVTVIIAMLIGLLTPALLGARAGARLTQCTNNLHEIGIATHVHRNLGAGLFPTADQTGNFCYRMAPGQKSRRDRGALPEIYGLEAFFVRKHLMPRNSGVWVCPSQPEWMREYGNTYAFSVARMLATRPEPDRLAMHLCVWDNFTVYPGLSGFRGPFKGYSIPQYLREYPHVSWMGRRGYNALYLDGHVEYKSFGD